MVEESSKREVKPTATARSLAPRQEVGYFSLVQTIAINPPQILLLQATAQVLFLDSRPLGVTSNEAPKEVRLFQFGLNKTQYGDLYLTPESARACLEYEAFLGRDLAWDWYHYSEPTGPKPPTKEDATAAAWFSLAIKADGLYAVAPKKLSQTPDVAALAGIRAPIDGIAWLPQGRADVQNLKIRYFSPAVQLATDAKTKQKYIVGVTSCALTNSPATLEQQPLLCSTPGSTKMNWEQILAALTARNATQAEIDQAKADFETATLASAHLSTPAPVPTPPAPPADAEARRLVLLAYSNRFTPNERASLEGLEPAVLERLLAARPVHALQNPAARPALLAQPAGQISGGNNPITWQGLPMDRLSYRNRHQLFLSDRSLFESMQRQARDQGRNPALLASADIANQPLLLATGTTASADIVNAIPVITNQAIEAGIAGLRAFLGSDVVMYDGSLPEWDIGGQRVKGGSEVRIPLYSAIGAFVDVVSEAAPASNTQKLETTGTLATVIHASCGVDLTYSAVAFAGMGSDPYVESARQLMLQGKNRMEDALITQARLTGLVLDISAVGDGKLSYDSIVDGLGLWGDEEFMMGTPALSANFVHSDALKQIRKIKDSDGRPIFYEPNNGAPPSMFGKPTMVSDRLVTVGGNNESLLARPRSLALWVNERKFRVEDFHDVVKDTTLTYVHLYFAAKLWPRVPGYSKVGVAKIIHK